MGQLSRRLLWIASPSVGETSEVWVLRQVDHLTSFDAEFLVWNDVRPKTQSAAIVRHVMSEPRPARLSESGAKKWLSRFQRLPHLNFYGSSVREAKSIVRLGAERVPSLLLSHYGQTALRMLAVSNRLDIPHVAHFHGSDLSSSLANRWYRWSLRAQLDKFDAVVVVGSAQRDWLVRQGWCNPDKIHLIPCGAPLQDFVRTKPISFDPLRFLTVSRLTPQKGLDINIRAFAQIRAEYPLASLTIVGSGKDLARLQPLVSELGLTESVRFTGALSPSEVRAQLDDASVFLQHSLDSEGFGVSLTEAMAMELPVIVSDCGGLADQVKDGETGLLCPQRDVAAVAAAMRQLAANPHVAFQMGKAASESARRNYDTAGQVAKLQQVLLDIVARREG